jgi:flagellar biosynthesis protein FlhG
MMKSVSRGMFKRPDKVIQIEGNKEQNYSFTSSATIAHNELFTSLKRPDNPSLSSPQIISIGGGKGGIGKSFFASNIGASLAKLGCRVALLDLDFGAANLHSCLGVTNTQCHIQNLINARDDEDFSNFGIPTSIPNLTLFAGGHEFLQQISLQNVDKIKLLSRIRKLNADYVILDLGAGTHINTLDFFIFSHTGIVIVVPEPTSIENAYVFLKSVFFRKVQSIAKAFDRDHLSDKLIQRLMDPHNQEPPINELKKFAQDHPELGQKFIDLLKKTNFSIIMNQVRSKMDHELGNSMSQICEKYFGILPTFLGSAEFDDQVWKSARIRKTLVSDFPNSPTSYNILKIAQKIQGNKVT